MALDVGPRLGPYEIAAKIGEGGTGQVYRARRLGGFVAIALSLAVCHTLPCEAQLASDRVPKVLLIGIDGVRPDVMADVSTPNLDALASGGFLIDDARTAMPSISGPSWSSMLTGVWPNKHGVTDNDFTTKRYDEYPDFLTRIERARPGLSTAVIADWMPLVYAKTGLPTIGDEVDTKHGVDGYEVGWAEADRRVTTLATDLLSMSDPDATFVYLGNPDETSHEHGSIGEEYRAAIELADSQVGEIVNAVRARTSYDQENWLILTSTDHGRRADGEHGGDTPEEMTIFVLLNGDEVVSAPRPGCTFIVDVAVTALTHLGVPVQPQWELDGTSLLTASGRSRPNETCH